MTPMSPVERTRAPLCAGLSLSASPGVTREFTETGRRVPVGETVFKMPAPLAPRD